MNNKQHIFSFFSKANQLLRKKHLLLIVSLCLGFLLTACEREESKKSDLGQVQLLRPVNGLAIKLENEALSVQYGGFATSSSVAISINGVLCGTQVGDICRLTHNRAYGAASASLASLGGVLLLGENTVTVKNTANGAQEVLDFYYDSHKPSIEITEIEVVNDTNNDGELNAGDIVTITGKIIDPSPIKTVYLYKAGQVAPIYFANSYTNDAEMADKLFTIPNVIWPDVNDPLPHFSYKITDIYNQVGEGKFLLNGAKLSNSQALQLNNTFFQHIAPVINYVIDWAHGALATDFAGIRASAITKIESEVAPFTNSFCSVLGWSGCSLDVSNLLITNPHLSIAGRENATFGLKLGVAFNAVEVPFTITSNAGDTFTSTLTLTSFELYSTLKLQPADNPATGLMKVERSPVKLYLAPKFLESNKQAYLRNSHCTGACKVGDILEFGYNLRLTKDGKAAADGMLNAIVQAAEGALGGIMPAETGQVIPNQLANQQLNLVKNLQAHAIDKTPRNLHLGFAGHIDDAILFDQITHLIDKPLLGTLVKGKNSYAPVKHAIFPSKQPGVEGKLIDIAYAISEDSVNQQLAALYQSGQPGFLGGGIGRPISDATTLFFGSTNAVCLESKAFTPPTVDFVGYYSKKTGFDWDFTGLELVNTHKEDIPGSIRLNMNNVSLTASDGNCSSTDQPIANAQNIKVDVAVRLFVYMENGKPKIKPYDRTDDSFIIVRAHEAEDSLVAAEFSKVLRAHVIKELDIFNQDSFKEKKLRDILGDDIMDAELAPNFSLDNMPPELRVFYGLQFFTFGIEPTGGYFSFTARVNAKSEKTAAYFQDWCVNNAGSYFRGYCVGH